MAHYQIFIRLLLSFVIAVSPIILINSANAANVGGWNLSNAVAQGSSTVYDATKNVVINGKDFVKDSWVKITPNANQVAKVLARGAAGYALSVAVEQLIGAVDWVLDPANNQIKWKEEGISGGTYIYLCTESINGCPSTTTMISPKPFGGDRMQEASDLCSAYASSLGGTKHSNSKSGTCIVTVAGTNKFYGIGTRTIEGEEGEEKTLPLPVVAEKVISNAESGDTNAQVATTAAAADIVAEAETDQTKARPIANQAEANAETKPADAAEAEKANEAQGQTKPNEANPEATDISLEFPVFCNWAPTVCQAAQVVISFPQTLTGWWESANQKADDWATSISEAWAAAKDWATTQNQDEPTELEIPAPEQQTVDTDISFNASCPAPYTLASFTAFGNSYNWTIDFSDMCSAITTFVRPVVIAMGALSAALIVGGVRDNG